MKRTNIFLPTPMLERIARISEKTGLPMAEIVRRAIEAYLKKEEK